MGGNKWFIKEFYKNSNKRIELEFSKLTRFMRDKTKVINVVSLF